MDKTYTRLPFGIPRDLAILACSMFLWGLGEGLFIYFYPLSLQRWTIDAVQIGAVLSGLGVTMALVQAPAGILSDRFGTRPLIRAGTILGVIAAGVMAAATSLPFFIFGLVIYSVTSFIVAPLNSYVTSMCGNWSAQRGITFISGSLQLGAIVGPMLGGRIAQAAGLAMVFAVSAGIFLGATAIVFLAGQPVARQDAQDSATPTTHPLTNPRFIGLLIILIFTIIGLSAPQQLSSMYLQEVHHLSLQQVGLTGTFAGIGAAVILFALGGLPAPAGMIAGQVLLGVFALLLWRGQTAPVFYIGYLFVGGYRLYHSMALAAVRPLVKPNELGLAYGLVETGNALAVILAPLVAGALYDTKPESVYTVSLMALAVTIAATAGWWFKFARR